MQDFPRIVRRESQGVVGLVRWVEMLTVGGFEERVHGLSVWLYELDLPRALEGFAKDVSGRPFLG